MQGYGIPIMTNNIPKKVPKYPKFSPIYPKIERDVVYHLISKITVVLRKMIHRIKTPATLPRKCFDYFISSFYEFILS